MALITRIGRLFRADFNAVLDRIEEPDVLLKQALREMEDDLHNDTQHLKILEKEYSQIKKNIKELNESFAQVNKELDICFESDANDLARSQVKRKLEMQRFEKHLKKKLNITEEKISELKSRINENKSRFITMQQKLDLLVNEKTTVQADEFSVNMNISVSDNDVEVAFLQEKQARSTS